MGRLAETGRRMAEAVPDRYRFELLPNGWVRVDDRASGLVGLFERDGTPYSGDLSRSVSASVIGTRVRVRFGGVDDGR